MKPADKQNDKANSEKNDGRYAYLGLERVFHERSRLGILSSLAGHPDGLLFNDLKALVALTDGNLSRQIQVLQEEGLLTVEKSFVNNRPQTRCLMSAEGKKRFWEYINELERVVHDAARADKQSPQRARPSTA
ncbi:MAG: transcriptional regulator [Burkholderiales bacterium]|nr:transcriptional regulator [Phycisphaerae bacterium]